MIKKLQIYSFITIIALLSCKTSWAKKDQHLSANQEYLLAIQCFNKKAYQDGIKHLENIEKNYPNHSLVKSAIALQAFFNYLDQEYDKAIVIAEVFLSTRAKNEFSDYLEFLKALSSYRQITGISKSQEITANSLEEMKSLANKQPNTIYGKKADEYAKYLYNIILANEILVGQSYQVSKDYASAIRRYNNIISNNITDLQPIAFLRLSECYAGLDLKEYQQYYTKLYEESLINFNGSISFTIDKFKYIAPLDQHQDNGLSWNFDNFIKKRKTTDYSNK